MNIQNLAELVVTQVVAEDLPEILAIETASFPLPLTENLLRMELNLHIANFYAVRWQEKIVGYVDYWRIAGEVHVITIAVHPDFRTQHIGSRLMEIMIGDAKEHGDKVISLDVRQSNSAAQGLYKKFGFQQAGLRSRYYQDNQEDGLVMNLNL